MSEAPQTNVPGTPEPPFPSLCQGSRTPRVLTLTLGPPWEPADEHYQAIPGPPHLMWRLLALCVPGTSPAWPRPTQLGPETCTPLLVSAGLYPAIVLGTAAVGWTSGRQGVCFQIAGSQRRLS